MGRIVSSYIFPHPPIIIPGVGRGNESGAQNTITAVIKAAKDIKNDKPTTIIVTTPHAPVFQDYFYISTDENLTGDFSAFGSPNISLNFKNNTSMVNRIIEHAESEGIYSGGVDDTLARKYKISKKLDHGALVPLYFVDKEFGGFKLVHISVSGLSPLDLYRFGMCIKEAVLESDEQVVFIASGDLSHRLSHDAPYGYDQRGKEFDELLIDSIKQSHVEKLLEMDPDLCESAGECGLRSFLIMYGALDGQVLTPDVYSYEGPFGVGYAIARFGVGENSADRRVFQKVMKEHSERMNDIRSNEDPYVALARKALETYVTKNKIMKTPEGLLQEMLENKAGTFVSIKKQGQLRGCIGTTGPTRANIAEEIIYNAISSGTRDPRFSPVEENELDKLVYSVDVLKKPEPITSIKELDIIKYGVIVKAGANSGLLLPNLDGVDTPEEQVAIALQKAGINPDKKYNMERFEVIRHK